MWLNSGGLYFKWCGTVHPLSLYLWMEYEVSTHCEVNLFCLCTNWVKFPCDWYSVNRAGKYFSLEDIRHTHIQVIIHHLINHHDKIPEFVIPEWQNEGFCHPAFFFMRNDKILQFKDLHSISPDLILCLLACCIEYTNMTPIYRDQRTVFFLVDCNIESNQSEVHYRWRTLALKSICVIMILHQYHSSFISLVEYTISN